MKPEHLTCVSSLSIVMATMACSSGPPAEMGRAEVTAAPSGATVPTVPPLIPTVAAPTAVEPPTDTAASTPAKLIERLRAQEVDRASVGRKTLLSWTTRNQAEEIVKGQPVLSYVESKQYGPSAFDWMLTDDMAMGSALAKLVFHEGFAKKRFAWSNAYATALGAGGGRYGAVLIKFDLKPNALILDFTSNKVFDVNNREVPLEEAVAHPERVAAAYWESTKAWAQFREYVILNTAAVEKVAFGTPEVLAVFDREKRLLHDLVTAWPSLNSKDQTEILDHFSRTLAFSSRGDVVLMKTFAREAEEVPPDTMKLSVAPSTEFTLGQARQALKVPTCKVTKSYDFSYTRTSCEPQQKCVYFSGKCELSLQSLHAVSDPP